MHKEFTKKEKNFLKKLNSAVKIQSFIDTLKYNSGKRISAIDVLRLKKADCLEAACLASYVFTLNRIESFIMDLSCKEIIDEDHVICVFRKKGLYGAVAQSKYLGLKSRNPVYRNLRELAMSYFENYFNYSGEYDLVARSSPLRIKQEWMSSQKSMKMIEKRLDKIKHISLVQKNIILPLVSREKFRSEVKLIPKGVKISKLYLK